MFSLDVTDIKRMEAKLKVFHSKAFPYATRQTINGYAFEAMQRAKINVNKDFVLRNKFTEKSIRVNQTRSLDVYNQEAAVGSVVEYMREQEFGGTKKKKGKHGVPIPTAVSAGLAPGTNPRTKTPMPRYKMAKIKLRYKAKNYISKKQANAVAIKQALRFGQKFVYLELTRKRGIFQITGDKKTLKIRTLKMLYDLTHTSISFKAREWLQPAVLFSKKRADEIYFKALKFQLDRFRIFK